jgi:apolipoprotein N-acyltransferase
VAEDLRRLSGTQTIPQISRVVRSQPLGGLGAQVAAVIATGLLVIFAFPMYIGETLLPEALSGYTAWVAFAPLLLVAEGRTSRRIALLFWAAAVIYFSGTLSWLVVTMRDFGHVPTPFAVLALVLLTSFLALFHAAAGYLAGRIQHRWRSSIVWPAALALTTMEFVRNYLFTGFPWSNIAYSQARFLHLIQIAELTGIYGLTFLIVLVGGGVAGVARWVARGDRRGWLHLAVGLALVGAAWGYGAARIPAVRAEVAATGEPLKVGLLQGNIPMDERWQAAHGDTVGATMANQVHLALGKGAQLIVWPEGSLPSLTQVTAPELPPTAFPPEGPGAKHIIGAITYTAPAAPGQDGSLYNSALLVDPARQIVARYSKSHLVPFGEYLPLPWLLGYLGPLVQQVGAFKQGEVVAPMSDGAHRFGVLICYEDLFPEIGLEMARKGADLLVAITNDTWYGRNMPRQHLDMAVFRAVETRVWVARAANTGISAFIDPIGEVVERTELYMPAVVVRELRLRPASGPYLALGDAFAYLCTLGVGLSLWRRPKQAKLEPEGAEA